jgi:hypothetical protein
MSRFVRILFACVLALGLSVASPGMALTFIAGDVQTNVEVGDVTTEARGALTSAETSIGSINDGSIVLRRARTTVQVKNVTTRAKGFNADACTSVGSTGACR